MKIELLGGPGDGWRFIVNPGTLTYGQYRVRTPYADFSYADYVSSPEG